MLSVAYLLVPISLLVPLIVVVRRYRSATGVRRLQLRWLLWAAAVDALVVLVAFSVSDAVASVLLILAVALTTGAVVVAITQYRLYDVDPLLSGTLAYGGLAAAVVVMDLLVVRVAGTAIDERESALLALFVVTLVYAPLRARGVGLGPALAARRTRRSIRRAGDSRLRSGAHRRCRQPAARGDPHGAVSVPLAVRPRRDRPPRR